MLIDTGEGACSPETGESGDGVVVTGEGSRESTVGDALLSTGAEFRFGCIVGVPSGGEDAGVGDLESLRGDENWDINERTLLWPIFAVFGV